ncbi:MAG: hypothetical protein IJV70_01210 [Clostridia bacterium]|nr:hypothetical protein [Clostridia bacterium]
MPRKNGRGFYYDPVEDTPIFKMVINEVRKIAQREYEEEMLRQYGTKVVLGGVHIYYSIEASVLYRKYGIRYVNNPQKLNHGLFID